jgi:sugar-specific transcriptional regulator TrmB
MHKAQVYRILKSLQNRGLIETTLEVPMRFSAVPLEHVVDLFIKAKQDETRILENQKPELLTHWQSLSIEQPPSPSERFVIIEGRSNVYSRILQMIDEAKHSIHVMTTSLGIIRADQAGIFDTIVEHDIELRLLTHVGPSNANIISNVIDMQSKHTHQHLIDMRHINPETPSCPRFVIKDGREVIFFITPAEDASIVARNELGLWTNATAIVSAQTLFFNELWRNAITIRQRIEELEAGALTKETTIVKDHTVAYTRFRQVIDTTTDEMLIITTAQTIPRMLNQYAIPQLAERGVRICILAPIVPNNFAAAQGLQPYCEIRHTDITFLREILIDNQYLFQLKSSPRDDEFAEVGSTAAFEDML